MLFSTFQTDMLFNNYHFKRELLGTQTGNTEQGWKTVRVKNKRHMNIDLTAANRSNVQSIL